MIPNCKIVNNSNDAKELPSNANLDDYSIINNKEGTWYISDSSSVINKPEGYPSSGFSLNVIKINNNLTRQEFIGIGDYAPRYRYQYESNNTLNWSDGWITINITRPNESSTPYYYTDFDMYFVSQMTDGTECTSEISTQSFYEIQSTNLPILLHRQSTMNWSDNWNFFVTSKATYENSSYSGIEVIKLNYINNYVSPATIGTFTISSENNKIYIGDKGSHTETSGGVACFTADTLISTPEGLKKISEIKLEDKVNSFNEETKQIEIKTVDKLVNHLSDRIYKISVGNDIIETTYSHPFFTLEKSKCLAENLKVGDTLRTIDNRLIQITGVETIEQPNTVVYEIRVEDNNNYFVGNENQVLVYNEQSVIEG